MLGYKKCKHYLEADKNGHCPFDVVCDEDCIFTLQGIRESYNELHKEYTDIHQELMYIENNENELDSLREQYDNLEAQYDEFKDQAKQYIAQLLTKLCKYETLQEVHSQFNELWELDELINKLNKENNNVE